MSSSDRRAVAPAAPLAPAATVAPWALDELAVPELFPAPSRVTPPADPSLDWQARQAAAVEQAVVAAEAAAYARGRADGLREARAELEADVTSVRDALRAAVASVELHAERWTGNAEENLTALAVTVARHIVQRELEADPALVRELVLRALAQLPLDQVVTVRLHPLDLAVCERLAAVDAQGRPVELRLLADPHVTRGGCLVEGRERVIDGRVDTALERAYRALGQVQA